MKLGLTRLIGAACVCITLAASLDAHAADTANACAAASLTNPDAIPPATGGMGGTGILADAKPKPVPPGTGGMGGTGVVAEVLPGTGGMGGTGIVGIVTGFASICVNNVEVHYDAKTPVSVNGQPGAARDLAVGQVVAVHARQVGDRLQANGVGIIDAVAGPVTRINAATRELQVMGQTVRTDAATGADLSSMQVGSMARVSGHRAPNGDVIATRIDTAGAGVASVLGTVTRLESDAVVVNGTRVNMNGRGTRGITVGSEVFAAGEWTGSALRAGRIDAQPVRNAIARNDRAILEGYVRGRTVRELNVGGVSVRIDDRVRYNGGNDRDAEVGRKVQIEVRRSGNEWQAERVILHRDERGGRRGERDVPGQRSGESSREGGDASGRSDSRNSGNSDSGSGRSDAGSGRSDSGSGRSDSGSGRSNSGSGRSNSGSGSSGRR